MLTFLEYIYIICLEKKEHRKMTFDKWFDGQSKLVKVILLVIPMVGWIVEVLVRLSALLRKSSTTNLLGFVLFLLVGAVACYIDAIVLILTDKLLIIE